MSKVSVIIPAYNREKFIARAIQSVLAQIYGDYEIIVVDDGSTDNTANIVKQFGGKVKYILQPNGGSASARNRGIKESQGEYIAFLDSDDFWVPEKLNEQVKVLDNNPNVGIVYAKMPIVNEKGEQVGMKPSQPSGKNFKELLEIWGDIPTSTVLTRRECFDKAGFFDTSLKTMQDIDMWLRIARLYDLYEIEGKVLAYYYRHSGQITQNRIKVYEGLVRIYTKIYKTFDDAPKDILRRRISMNTYTLSRTYYDERHFRKALSLLVGVMIGDPLVGRLFFLQSDDILGKFIKLLKPFGFLAICSLKSVLSSK